MASERELVALQSIGVSPFRIMLPAVLVGVLVCIMSFWAAFTLGPYGNRKFEISINEAFGRKILNVLRSGTFTEGTLDFVLFVDRVDQNTQKLNNVFLHDDKSFDGIFVRRPAGIICLSF